MARVQPSASQRTALESCMGFGGSCNGVGWRRNGCCLSGGVSRSAECRPCAQDHIRARARCMPTSVRLDRPFHALRSRCVMGHASVGEGACSVCIVIRRGAPLATPTDRQRIEGCVESLPRGAFWLESVASSLRLREVPRSGACGGSADRYSAVVGNVSDRASV